MADRSAHLTGDINDRLPILAHSDQGGPPDCCGCLVADVEGDQTDIVCNECGIVIRTLPTADVERFMGELLMQGSICTARCPHCGDVSTFPGFSSMIFYTCQHCGEAVTVEEKVH